MSVVQKSVRPNASAASETKGRVAIVGGGIAGLAHAWSAARRGHQVTLFERHPLAAGASVRNFGTIWPIGQPQGPLHEAALLSRDCWLELLHETRVWHAKAGSIHLAYRPDELDVLDEFQQASADMGYELSLLVPREVRDRSPAARCEGLLAGLWSPTEMCVDPREIIAMMPKWLHERYGVELNYQTQIQQVSMPWIVATDGRRWQTDRAIIAAGIDFNALYPDEYRRAGFQACKLQMMRTVAQSQSWRLGPILAGGLTLRHYASFAECPSLPALKERINNETPELNEYGIHVLAAQNGRGEVILGDSHEYDANVQPFDKSMIDELILRELRRIIDLPDWTISEHWHGIYPKVPDTIQFVHTPEPGVTAVIPAGGCGMTMSFGLAELQWADWSDASTHRLHGLPT